MIGYAVFDHGQRQQPLDLVCLYHSTKKGRTYSSGRHHFHAHGLIVKSTGNVSKRVGFFELDFEWETWSPDYGMDVDYKYVVLQ